MAVSGMHVLGPIILKTISPCHAAKLILTPELLIGVIWVMAFWTTDVESSSLCIFTQSATQIKPKQVL
jgi:hypothetical protein